ncbi:hypothetical protein M3Y97_01063400 [Aphelenchoides bicaudatus]|nr:hypothetical protein M3Y97_01063400 [Aphelenchoides bicaudatus]
MFNKNDRNESKIKIEGVLNEIDALTELDEALDQFDESTQPNRLLHSLFNTSEPSTSNVITEKNFPQTPPPRKHNKCSGCQQLKHCLRGDLCQICHLKKQSLKTHRECRNCSQIKSTQWNLQVMSFKRTSSITA